MYGLSNRKKGRVCGKYSYQIVFCWQAILADHIVRACLNFFFASESCGRAVLELHSSAMGREKREARFLYRQVAAQRMNFKHAQTRKRHSKNGSAFSSQL